ncbi:MAG: flavodoxin family protein [Syntrophobacter sp.]
MRAIAINGSPRKRWNTATLLKHALAGAAKQGAETELVHLYDLDYKGCSSCFACKKIGGKSYGRCAIRDDLTPILKKVVEADVLILGSPLYFYTETGEMRSFMERLLFPFLTYTPGYVSIFPGKIQTGFVYTMNVAEQNLAAYGQDRTVAASQGVLTRVLGNCDVLLCTDTCQFSDYSKYVSSCWDAEAKEKRRKEVFPLDCKRAFEMGAKLATTAIGS